MSNRLAQETLTWPSTPGIASNESAELGTPLGLMAHSTFLVSQKCNFGAWNIGSYSELLASVPKNFNGLNLFDAFATAIHGLQVKNDEVILSIVSQNAILEQKISDLTKRMADLGMRRIFVVPVTSLDPEPFVLLKNIPATIEGDGEDFTATWVEANISASAESEADAILNLKDCLISRFEIFKNTPIEKMAPLPRRQWEMLKTVIREK